MFQKCSDCSFVTLSPCVELSHPAPAPSTCIGSPVAGEVLFVPRLFCSWCEKKSSYVVDGKYLRIKTISSFPAEK